MTNTFKALRHVSTTLDGIIVTEGKWQASGQTQFMAVWAGTNFVAYGSTSGKARKRVRALIAAMVPSK